MKLYRHKKRGTTYEIIGFGTMQIINSLDGTKVVIYKDVDNGSLWVRPEDEFFDGRFEEVVSK